MNIHELEKRIGYSFKQIDLLQTALTHPSYSCEHHDHKDYQRLEFLGDAVLELSISHELYFKLPKVDEGKLTRIRQALVREETLSCAARRIALGDFIRMSIGEERTGGRGKPSILCDVMESVIAAVYLDGGFEAADALIHRLLAQELNAEDIMRDRLDAKSRLQELLQKAERMPVYEFVSSEGPPHAPVFYYRVLVNGETVGEGSGSSKQNAQQAAAREALTRMGALSN